MRKTRFRSDDGGDRETIKKNPCNWTRARDRARGDCDTVLLLCIHFIILKLNFDLANVMNATDEIMGWHTVIVVHCG